MQSLISEEWQFCRTTSDKSILITKEGFTIGEIQNEQIARHIISMQRHWLAANPSQREEQTS